MTRSSITKAAALLRPPGRRCERGGVNPAVHAHHRRLASQGGQDVTSNLAALCAQCHRWVHEHPALAAVEGWIVVAGSDPADVPLRLWDGRIAWLNDEAGYERLEEANSPANRSAPEIRCP